ncbi:3D domain-containing protein [Gorillibacterium massiliense]|uniref:3D domain-containing protein n=1 Tax=Gorillibacterium massiliense TaxID=1280390 RepID=UPI0004B845CD|nr:3D domain-containing protein [Gorillibacterium massiliense]
MNNKTNRMVSGFKKRHAAKAALSLALALAVVAPTTVSAASATSAGTYTIKAGDTFWKIAKAKNLDLNAVLKLNANANPLNLQIGQVVKLPTTANTVKISSFAPAAASTTTLAGIGSYKKKLTVSATAYSSAPEENGWGAVDYFGNPLALGTVAVDPKVIPMNSKLYITGYNNPDLPAGGMIAYAKDQGSAIKGNRVDIFIPGSASRVSNFGIQDITVYVLE